MTSSYDVQDAVSLHDLRLTLKSATSERLVFTTNCSEPVEVWVEPDQVLITIAYNYTHLTQSAIVSVPKTLALVAYPSSLDLTVLANDPACAQTMEQLFQLIPEARRYTTARSSIFLRRLLEHFIDPFTNVYVRSASPFQRPSLEGYRFQQQLAANHELATILEDVLTVFWPTGWSANGWLISQRQITIRESRDKTHHNIAKSYRDIIPDKMSNKMFAVLDSAHKKAASLKALMEVVQRARAFPIGGNTLIGHNALHRTVSSS